MLSDSFESNLLKGLRRPSAPNGNRKHFALMHTLDDLTEAEHRFALAVREGTKVEFRSREASNASDPSCVWDHKNTLRAEVIRALCMNADSEDENDTLGIFIIGAKITGQLNLEGISFSGPLRLINCRFDSKIIFRLSCIKLVELTGSFVPNGIDGYRMTVDHDLLMNGGFVSLGEVTLHGASLGGNLYAEGAKFEGENGIALKAVGATVGGSITLSNSIAKGEVHLNSVAIGGYLDCTSADFQNPAGFALVLVRVASKNGVFLRHGFASQGSVRINNSQIGANLECLNATFSNIDGTAFMLNGTSVKGTFFWREVETQGEVQLHDAEVDRLSDDKQSWPESGKLNLSGFRYRTIQSQSPRSAPERLSWLRLQSEFNSESYERLILVFRRLGLDHEARSIAIAKQIDLRRSGRLGFLGRLQNRFLGITVAHGYRPSLALIWASFIVLIGWACFSIADKNLAMIPSSQDSILIRPDTPANIRPDYPSFNAFMYSVDVFLPVVDLHQERYWIPKKLDVASAMELPSWVVSVLTWRYWIYFWIHIIAGWILTTVLIGSLTGLIKRG